MERFSRRQGFGLMLGASQAVLLGAGQWVASQSYLQRVNRKNPDWYLSLSETGGTTANAEAGVLGTYVNSPRFGVDSIAQHDDGSCVGLDGATLGPAHITCSSPLSGTELTIDLILQLDDLNGKHVVITTLGGTQPGQFSVEVLTGGQVRAWSVDDGGTVQEILGTVGDLVQGTAHKLTYQRQSGVAGWSHRILVDGAAKAQDTTTRTWGAVPSGTVYIGTWVSSGPSYLDPTDGLIAHVAGWNAVVDLDELDALGKSIAWAEDIDAGSIITEHSAVISVKQGGWHGREPLIITAGDGSLVTTVADGDEITITSYMEIGVDNFTYNFTDANGNTSPTRNVAVLVGSALTALAQWDLDEAFGATTVVDAKGIASGSHVGQPQKGTPAIVSGGGDSLGLDGWHDYVQIPHDAALAVANGTICGYGQCHALGWDQTIIRKGSALAVTVTGDGHIRAEIGGATLESSTDFEIDAGQAFFFALTFGSDGAKLYLRAAGSNLQLVASHSTTGGLASGTGTLYFGTRPDGSYPLQLRFFGFLSTIQLFDEALTQADLAAFAAPATADVYHETRPYYGFGIGQWAAGSGAANSTMNQTNNGYAFTATRTGNIDRWRMNLRQGSGYSLGDGGTYRVSICPANPANDDPDFTQRAVLHSGWAPGNLGVSRYEEIVAESAQPTVRGRRYFLTFENLNDPSNNYSSQNVIKNGRLGDDVDPSSINRIRDGEAAVGEYTGLTWFRGLTLPSMWRGSGFSRFRGVPMGLGIRYGSEAEWSLSTISYGCRNDEDYEELYGSQRVARISWTQPDDAVADGVWLNIHKWGSAGDLSVTLKHNDTTLATATVPVSEISAGIDGTSGSSNKYADGGPIEWVLATFSSLQTLIADEAYSIELRSPGSTNGSNCIMLGGVATVQNPGGGGDTWAVGKEGWLHVGGYGACEWSTDNGSSWVYFLKQGTRMGWTELPVSIRFVPELVA